MFISRAQQRGQLIMNHRVYVNYCR